MPPRAITTAAAGRRLAWAIVLTVGTGCVGAPLPAILTVAETGPEPSPVLANQRCIVSNVAPTDPDLLGLSRTHEPRCCPSDYGFDPELVRTSCGFSEYLGESEELACVHRFRQADGAVHELRLTPVVDLEFDAAVALHERGSFAPDHFGEAPPTLEHLWWSQDAGRWWAFVPGWSAVRRLGWDANACEPTAMLPVLARMLEASDDGRPAVALPRLFTELDEERNPASETDPIDPEPSLGSREWPATRAGARYPLPRAADQLVEALLGAASADDLDPFMALLEPDARIGLPDRRQPGARSILAGVGPRAAARALLDGAARFPASARLSCPDIDRRVRPRVTRGEHLMWCFWASEDGLDLLAFGLRGAVEDGEATGHVAYLGVFPVRPMAPLVLPGEPPPPPVIPIPTLVCGDPHTQAYPELCPAPAEPGELEGEPEGEPEGELELELDASDEAAL